MWTTGLILGPIALKASHWTHHRLTSLDVTFNQSSLFTESSLNRHSVRSRGFDSRQTYDIDCISEVGPPCPPPDCPRRRSPIKSPSLTDAYSVSLCHTWDFFLSLWSRDSFWNIKYKLCVYWLQDSKRYCIPIKDWKRTRIVSIGRVLRADHTSGDHWIHWNHSNWVQWCDSYSCGITALITTKSLFGFEFWGNIQLNVFHNKFKSIDAINAKIRVFFGHFCSPLLESVMTEIRTIASDMKILTAISKHLFGRKPWKLFAVMAELTSFHYSN